MNPDWLTVVTWELVLVSVFIVALYRDRGFRLLRFRSIKIQRLRKLLSRSNLFRRNKASSVALYSKTKISATPTVDRGQFTMGLVTGTYATVLGSSYAVVSSASCIEGWQATWMALNTLLLGYLFFFSGWWRNRVLLPLHRKVRRD